MGYALARMGVSYMGMGSYVGVGLCGSHGCDDDGNGDNDVQAHYHHHNHHAPVIHKKRCLRRFTRV